MPPSTSKRGRTRKQPDPPEKSDAEDIEDVATPSRKRRKVTNTPQNTAGTNGVDNAGPATETTSYASRQKRSSDVTVYEDQEIDADTVIRNLRKANYQIAARLDHANEVHEQRNPHGKRAYAKIAGNGWTFYVDELEVHIGRPPDERQSETTGEAAAANNAPDKSLVHIDLGPHKHVSRQHADIRYNETTQLWDLFVNGRNGAKIDERILERGDTAVLHSGCVIEIAGTQMMFVTPSGVPDIHPSILQQAREQEERDEDDDDGELMGPPSLPHRTPTKGNGSTSTYPSKPPSSSRGRQSSGKPNMPADEPGNSGTSTKLAQNDSSAEAPFETSRADHKVSPTFPRGLMLETAEDIDYSADNARDLKPPHSYAQMIGMAILSSAEEKLTLSKIYDYIKDHYAYYRFSGGGWQNSIRHNLSLNKSFEKVARRTNEPGKGMKWQIVPEQREDFIRKGLALVAKQAGRASSMPTSPTKDNVASTGDPRDPEQHHSQDNHDSKASKDAKTQNIKTSPGSTPPMSHYSSLKQAITPERASKVQGQDGSSPIKGLGIPFSPWPFSVKKGDRWNALTDAAAAGTPGGPRIALGSDANEHMFTPLISRHAPKLAPPSTAHLPSQFMPMSSPAPFWKYADFDAPAHKLESSPVKVKKPGLSHDASNMDVASKEEAGEEQTGRIRSSSPPLPEADIGQGSPTRAVASRGMDKPSSLLNGASAQTQIGTGTRNLLTKGAEHTNGHRTSGIAAQEPPEEDEEEDEGGMIDLAKGFQPIGVFHRNMGTGPGLVGKG